ncbi:hypothetical protein T06_16650, partial [Trichinella sp. T6]
LQIRIDKSLWPYQMVVFKGKRYCLTRLGFGLNVAPLVMKAVLNCALPGSGSQERNLGVHRRHPGERKRRRRGPREAEPGALWADVQNPRACR